MKELSDELARRLAEYTSYKATPEEALALFEEARAAGCPIARSEMLGGYHMLLDYEDVRNAHRDWHTFSSEPAVLRPIVPRPRFPPIEFDPPMHKEWRDLFAKAVNTNTPKLHEQAVRDYVIQLLQDLRERDTFDLVENFAEEIALFTICRILGFDSDKRHEVRRLTLEMYQYAEDPVRGPMAFQAFAEFGVIEVMRRLQEPKDDYLTVLATARIGGQPLTTVEIGSAMNSLLNAGHGTTVTGLTSLLHEVLSRPGVRMRLSENPALITTAVEESLRLHTPFFGLYRRVTRDTTVQGAKLSEGDSVFLCWAAANRDPKVFNNPNEFDLDRALEARPHLTFGLGIHACMGRPIAQMEMRVALEELLARAPGLELIDRSTTRYTFGGAETASIGHLPARIVP